jgi:hypothetical protein
LTTTFFGAVAATGYNAVMRFRLRSLFALLTVIACLIGVVAWARRPSVDVLESVVDAGGVVRGTHGTSAFTVINRGSRPVRLTRDTTIGRAYCDADCVTIPAGESRQVLIRWQGPLPMDDFNRRRSIACIRFATSDRRRPWIELTTIGHLVD